MRNVVALESIVHCVSTAIRTIGILGVGKVGTVLARLAIAAGYRVVVAGSGPAEKISLITQVLAPGADAVTAETAIAESDVVILAIPLGKFRSIQAPLLRGKLVVDAMNYWWPIDGILSEFEDAATSSSEIVRSFIPEARLVKTFNHMGYHELDEDGRAPGDPDRKALAIAGDDRDDVEAVAGVIDAMGFDAVNAGTLAEGVRFEPKTELFGASVDRDEVVAMLARFDDSAFGQMVARSRLEKAG
ncbi:MAG: 8-hydroxy-5-deazaflavin:NADPH oxidoreductase [Microbacteriaceae bacterium]|nr:8-hydroxy-5-deazaflavin:NADPH oxidoreductase [Microbacteriaceae bacterium]